MMLKLHYLEGCPYCIRVQDKLDELKLPYKLINAEEDDFDTVMKIADIDMVPVLEDGKRVIQESKKIINYLDKTYGPKRRSRFSRIFRRKGR